MIQTQALAKHESLRQEGPTELPANGWNCREYSLEGQASTLQTIDRQDVGERKAMVAHILLDGQKEAALFGDP